MVDINVISVLGSDTILRLSSPSFTASTTHHHPIPPSPVGPNSSTQLHESSSKDDQDSRKIFRLFGKDIVCPLANPKSIDTISRSSPSSTVSTTHHHPYVVFVAKPLRCVPPSLVGHNSSTQLPHESSSQDHQDSTKIRLFGKDINKPAPKTKSDATMRRSSPSCSGLTTHHHPYVVYDAVPLRCVLPSPIGPDYSSSSQDLHDSRKRKHNDNVGVAGVWDGHKEKKKRKPYERKKPYVKRTKQDGEDGVGFNNEKKAPVIPPGLLQRIQSREAPEFLYQKKLTSHDVDKHQNRLFIDKAGKSTMMKFLSPDELHSLDNDKDGVKGIKAVDREGGEYTLDLTIWPSVKSQLVIKLDWHKLVVANHAEEGDQVQIWGWQNEMGKTCLAINFITSLELKM